MPKIVTKEDFLNKLSSKGRTDIVLIGDYINMKTKALFKCKKCGNEWETEPRNVSDGTGCPNCAHFKTHEQFIKDFEEKGNPSLEIIGKYVSNRTPIKVRCKECGHEFENTPAELLLGTRCLICTGHLVLPDVNSVAALCPDLVKYFKNSNDAYSITPGSSKKVSLICPDCGSEKTMVMRNLFKRGFSCDICGDKISYPNKLIRNIMYQLKDECDYLEFEWFEKWKDKYRYDVYFEKNNQKYVIEMQGEQHYRGWKGYNLKEIQQNDQIKKDLAISNNIIPIIIDAEKSDFDYIFNNIKNSLLSKIFNLSNIDINTCKEHSMKNIIKLICQDYNDMTTTELMDKYKLCRSTVVKYLHKGTQLGWCNYNPKESHLKSLDVHKKKVDVYTKNGEFIGTYDSIKEGIEVVKNLYGIKLSNGSITEVCQGKRNHHHGFVFKYI